MKARDILTRMGHLAPAGCVSLWNAKRPTSRMAGPAPVYSAASTQPDANGNLVTWPNYVPGRGVEVHGPFTQMLQNSKFEGAVSGTPGTAPTNWAAAANGGSISAVSVSSLTLTVPNAARHFYSQTATLLANTTYYFDANISIASGSTTLWNMLFATSAPSGSTVSYELAGAEIAGSTVLSAGAHEVGIKVVVAATAGTVSLRWGIGCQGNTANEVVATFSKLKMSSSYHFSYLASGAGATASAASTAGDEDPENGMAFLLDNRMTAALGGVFTAAVLVNMQASSAEIAADTNIISINDSVTGGIYAASGGVLKAFDGTNTATVTVTGGWARGETLFIPWWINGAGTQQQIGCKKSAESAITWGTAADYAVFAPGTHLRWGYAIDKTIGAIQGQLWNKSVETDAKLLDLLRYAS